MVLISLFAIGAVTASDADNMTDVMEVSADDEIAIIDENQNVNEVLSEGNASEVELDLTVENITYGERIVINAIVADNTKTINFTESGVGVEIEIDGKYISRAPINPITGVSGGSFNLSYLDVGTHYVQTTLINGTNKILTKEAVFSIAKAIPIVEAQDVIVNAYENVTVPINVTDKNGKGISGDAIVTIVWQSDSLSKRVKVVDGSASAFFDFTDIIGIISSMGMEEMMGAMMGGDSGGIDWASMFGGNGTGSGSGFNWSQIGNMNWTEMFNGSGSGNGMNWEEMFSGNGTGSGNMMEGMMSVSFENLLLPGNYNVTTTFLSNRNYDTANTTSNLIVAYLEDVVYFADITSPKKLGDNGTVTITVLDKFSRPIPNIVVDVILDGKQMSNVTLNENGTAKLSLTNLVNGNHKLVLQSNINGSLTNKSFDFDVQLAKANVTIAAKDISITTVNVNVDGKIGKYFTATLKDELNNTLVKKSVQISINNQKYTVKTDENGVAKLQINIAKAGAYTCTVAFLGDDTYNGAFDIAKVTVNKQTAKLTVAKKTYKANAKTKKFTATFKSAKGKVIAGKKITFKVQGKTYTAKTNSKGVATVNVKLTKKGTYNVVAKFAGDNTYKAISKTGKLILK